MGKLEEFIHGTKPSQALTMHLNRKNKDTITFVGKRMWIADACYGDQLVGEWWDDRYRGYTMEAVGQPLTHYRLDIEKRATWIDM